VDSSEPVLNFLGRGEVKSETTSRTSIVRTPTSGTAQEWDCPSARSSGDLQQKLGGPIQRTAQLHSETNIPAAEFI
jgi:hypothetical protein